MGLGGYLASKSEIDHFDAERAREEYEIVHFPQAEEQEIVDIFEPYGLSRDEIQPILKKLKSNPKAYVDFMMKFELNLERPSEWRSTISAATIGLAYFFGGLLPLLPYLLTTDTIRGLAFSSIVTLFALYVFGIFRARFIGLHSVHKSAFQTLGIGAVAAGGSFALVKLMG
ncbi:Vacuolar iron transporter [Zancudomyces culisetae]|uniref:Vacuolar iron transporter n=1 Tax=Zancudomyces culisetae TaxID=1213189 RepID=A0A1R1PWQ1_ZANCU|nr:Vacuolar iron transporter [Zancudomyces culisetae]OMH85359.1 Vacuolar iron transporter [Zancudomyces culisetae]|eukprot:OMH81249.1 Vacuolar iron transporter [Zancudomyces culisetae]